jgi:O-antigen ligase
VWWCWHHLQKPSPTIPLGWQPVRSAQLILLGVASASYIAAMLRPLPTGELSQADAGLLRLLAAAGVVMVATDGIPDAARFGALVRRVVWGGCLLATLGLVQFATGHSFVDALSIPGLTATQDFSAVTSRSGFTRSAGTAMSPLEYAAALSMILPLALTHALYGAPSRGRPAWLNSRLGRWLPAALITLAMVLSTSRSALLGLAVGVGMLFPSWRRSVRIGMSAAGLAVVAAVSVLVPGMIGTMRNMFSGVSNDPSTQSRTGSYELAMHFVGQSPVLGRGFGTFLPQYRILDNEYLLLLVEMGVLGFLAVVNLMLTGAACAVLGSRAQQDQFMRPVGRALAASLAAGALLVAFFDAFSFPMALGCLSLILGLSGGYWRLTRLDRQERTSVR